MRSKVFYRGGLLPGLLLGRHSAGGWAAFIWQWRRSASSGDGCPTEIPEPEPEPSPGRWKPNPGFFSTGRLAGGGVEIETFGSPLLNAG
jgi:hypothetical protein